MKFMVSSPHEMVKQFGKTFEKQSESRQSIADHMVASALFSKGTPAEKAQLLFEIIKLFEPRDNLVSGKVSLICAKDCIHRIHQFLIINLPYHAVSDAADMILYKDLPRVVDARLEGVKCQKPEHADLTFLFNELSLINMHVANTRDVIFTTEQLFNWIKCYRGGNVIDEVQSSVRVEVAYVFKGKQAKKVIPLNFEHAKKCANDRSYSMDRPVFPQTKKCKTAEDLLSKCLETHIIKLVNTHDSIDFEEFMAIVNQTPILNWAISCSPHYSHG